MDRNRSGVDEHYILKTIAETLNKGVDLGEMLQDVLERLLDVTENETGWIFLSDEPPSFTCAADHNLPPALTLRDKEPMCQGACWCLASFWEERLEGAANIMECKRLDDAVRLSRGETRGIQHHATIPLTVGAKRYGLLNVASPGKTRFTARELALLESISLQIGTAIGRVRLFQHEQERAIRYAQVGEVTQALIRPATPEALLEGVVRTIGETCGWPHVAILLDHEGASAFGVIWNDGDVRTTRTSYAHDDGDPAMLSAQLFGAAEKVSTTSVPLQIHGEQAGMMLVGSERIRGFHPWDLEAVRLLASHVSLAVESARLQRQRQDFVRLDERIRLARDLHDSISQALFSLTFTARGAEAMVEGQPERVRDALVDIQGLARQAQEAMRTIIRQLRPEGLEEGLVSALERHARSLGLTIAAEVSGSHALPKTVEEALWRIGQEALNNVSRHAGVRTARLNYVVSDEAASLTVQDDGSGASVPSHAPPTFGVVGMRERAEALGGTFTFVSLAGRGTTVTARIPFEGRPPKAASRHRQKEDV